MYEHIDKNTKIRIENSDFLKCYKNWEGLPTVIVADGPYGINGYPGDLMSCDNIAKWYEPFVDAWTKSSAPQTTLWFWNTELGWASVHNMILSKGWDFVNCHIWDKGLGHVAGNVNSKTIRQFPIVTEVCVQYVRRAEFVVENQNMSMQDWLRHEWERTGLPFSKTNEACGVKNAATRKYFTKCHLWYFPPADAFEKIANYANENGNPNGLPYFSINGKRPLTKDEWELMRSKFYCKFGVSNVWRQSQVNGAERLKNGTKALHTNQKPLSLMKLIIEASSDKGDIVWEPFGGLCSASLAAYELGRNSFASEINSEVFSSAVQRIETIVSQLQLDLLEV